MEIWIEFLATLESVPVIYLIILLGLAAIGLAAFAISAVVRIALKKGE